MKDQAGWRTARRYGVPVPMLAEATRRRLAGDWRGACGAARVDVRFDLDALRDQHGTELAGRVEDDLRHLVPDLVRWHLPRRVRGGLGLLEPELVVVLSSYAGDGTGPALWLRTPAHQNRPQRIELGVGPVPDPVPVSWETARYLWDDRATGDLLGRVGGGDRTPFFTRDGRRLTDAELPTVDPTDPVAVTERVLLLQDQDRLEEAWAAAGVPASFPEAEADWRGRANPGERYAMVPALRDALLRWHRVHPEQTTFVLCSPSSRWQQRSVQVTVDGDGVSATLVGRSVADDLPWAPVPWWERLPDLDLLRHGLIDHSGLHPLVRAALFPEAPEPDAYRPGEDAVSNSVAVRCRGVWHRVGWRDGRVEPHDHSPEEAQRERVLRTLGGEVPRCFMVTEAWRGLAPGRLPRPLRDLRGRALAMVMHGDRDGFLDLLDRGVDPAGLRDRKGRGVLHLLAHLDLPELVPRLVAAGLDVNGPDAINRAPLGQVLFDGGSAALVRALLDAGASPTARDSFDCSALHLMRSYDAATIVPWLIEAGVDLEAHDGYGRTPLMSQVIAMAPVEAIRATVAAGANLSTKDHYTDETLVELLSYQGRDDLEFLRVAAVQARESGDD